MGIYWKWSVIIVVALFCFFSCGPTSQNLTIGPNENAEIRTYEVFGMDCPGCAGALNKQIKKLPSVMDSQADWKGKKLYIKVPRGSELSDEDVHKAIKKSNFTPGKRI
jgi:copper chaperone CopZ